MPFLVVANWKMSGDVASLRDFLAVLHESGLLDGDSATTYELVLSLPFTIIHAFKSRSACLKLGAQNCSGIKRGCTGEISAEMLREFGCEYVILGHSDRRTLLCESDLEIRHKAECAMDTGLVPIICLGETLQEREGGVFRDILLRQCRDCLPKRGIFTVAYEPIWAIGKSEIPPLEMIEESFEVIRSSGLVDKVLYGGSINHSNIRFIVTGVNHLKGVLIGGASRRVDTFSDVLRSLLDSF